MSSPANAISILLISLLAGCSQTVKPASVAGECGVFRDPGFEVKGATRRDQKWISGTQEKGIKICGWPRPAAETKG